MTRILISECACPACGVKLDAAPSRKKQCPSCKQFMYVRTTVADREKYLVTEDEIEKIEREWTQYYENQATQPQRTEEEYERLFNMPLRVSVERKRRQSLTSKLFGKKAEPVRWVLGSWCKAHCKRIAGYPSCHDLAGEYPDGWDSLQAIPTGEIACHSDEFVQWWYDHHNENEEGPCCDCHIEVFHNGKWTGGL